ncbi:phosphoribosylformylglycinamidine synthase I [Patescibacteria group bacterium]|nr:phosphoribosylformylglycinamidine synthase I [Patescibacteria group bacterium]
MHRIAIIIFPGTNCHQESFRAIKKAGMEPVYFRWNESYEELKKFDGYFIPGGFSYEDRVRSGAIAARDQIMSVIKEEVLAGKPVIGICNGAQILVESGMIPGLSGHNLTAALASNERGYLNIWVNIINNQEQGCCAFTIDFPQGEHFCLPIAHGEGRYVIDDDQLKKLIDNGQTVFRYCDDNGQIKEEYPINPNGAVYNLAGVCNPQGNVLALMPHPERTSHVKIFESMKKYLDKNPKSDPRLDRGRNPKQIQISKIQNSKPKINGYQVTANAFEIYVDLIITDNEAQTLTNALHQMSFRNVEVYKKKHWEIVLKDQPDFKKFTKDLITSGELLNTNKEIAYIKLKDKIFKYSAEGLTPVESIPEVGDVNLLVRDKNDYLGQGKLNTLQNRLNIKSVKSVKSGVVWQIKIKSKTQEEAKKVWEEIQKSNILFNPFSQEALIIC